MINWGVQRVLDFIRSVRLGLVELDSAFWLLAAFGVVMLILTLANSLRGGADPARQRKRETGLYLLTSGGFIALLVGLLTVGHYLPAPGRSGHIPLLAGVLVVAEFFAGTYARWRKDPEREENREDLRRRAVLLLAAEGIGLLGLLGKSLVESGGF